MEFYFTPINDIINFHGFHWGEMKKPTYKGYNLYKLTFRNSFLERICPKQMVMLVSLRKPSSMAKRVECITSSSCSAHSWGILLALNDGNWVWIGGWYSNHQIFLGVFKILQIFFVGTCRNIHFCQWQLIGWFVLGQFWTLRIPSLNSMWKYDEIRRTYETNSKGNLRMQQRLWCDLLSQKSGCKALWVSQVMEAKRLDLFHRFGYVWISRSRHLGLDYAG